MMESTGFSLKVIIDSESFSGELDRRSLQEAFSVTVSVIEYQSDSKNQMDYPLLGLTEPDGFTIGNDFECGSSLQLVAHAHWLPSGQCKFEVADPHSTEARISE